MAVKDDSQHHPRKGSTMTTNNIRVNLDLTAAALETAVNELAETQDELSKVKNELAMAEAKMARFDKIREHDFNYLLREYAYNIWRDAAFKHDGNDDGRIEAVASAQAIRAAISVMYQRDVTAYMAPNPNHLLIEVREWVSGEYKATMYCHWDADEPFNSALNEAVHVK